jgi:hypothetical protein
MRKEDNILKLIRYIVCFATDHDIRLTTIRLVKFLYLADLYFARGHQGDTITKFPWAFVYYGPYCSDALKQIEEATIEGLISRATYESHYGNKDYSLYTCPDDDYDELARIFPIEVISELQHAIKKYGDDTAQLLDYVYFETEPMMGVKKGDRLDFTKAFSPRFNFSVQTKNISAADIKKIKHHIDQLGAKLKAAHGNLIRDAQVTAVLKDDYYNEALIYFDEDELPTGAKGTITII